MNDIVSQITALSDAYASRLQKQIQLRKEQMKLDDTSHYLIYQVLGISCREGYLIDEYQNTGRFLYKYAGSFLEEAATCCLKLAYPEGEKIKIPNTLGTRPKTFEIDFFNEPDAIEIKWRDATTDGDHITKEHTRLQAIQNKGYKPIRIMFFYPQRQQAIRIQETLKTLYAGLHGEYYGGDEAWGFLCKYTKIDLKNILIDIAQKRGMEHHEV